MNETGSMEPDGVLRGLDPLSDREKSKSVHALLLGGDTKQSAFARVSHPRCTDYQISVHRDLQRNITHVHKNHLRRPRTLQSLTYNYEGINAHPVGKGLLPIASRNLIKNFSVGMEDCRSISSLILPWTLAPDELYMKFAKVEVNRTFAKKIVSFLRRNRDNLKWIKLTLKGSSLSNLNRGYISNHRVCSERK